MFSGTVKIGDAADFISPAQDCVVSLGGNKQPLVDDLEEASMVHVHRIRAPHGSQAPAPISLPPPPIPAAPVTISLNDCLACSGCVTSAETVLLQAQSSAEVRQRLAAARRPGSERVVFSLSPQSVASLAAAACVAPGAMERRLAAALRALGAVAVFSTSPARDLCLADAAAEAAERLAARAAGRPVHLPILASACPGWICYAEKTHGAWALGHLSRTKSPQAVAASLIKGWWAAGAGLTASQVFHCSIMPCYDKKLEASREDFTVAVPGVAQPVPETDCVLASSEVAELLAGEGLALDGPISGEDVPLDCLPCCPPGDAAAGDTRAAGAGWVGTVHAGSGGYMEAVLRGVARTVYGVDLGGAAMVTVSGRNSDVQETSLEVHGQTVFRCAAVYGFRNIQGLMRRMRLNKSPYDYVEVMACPSGCLNGGGQVRPRPGQTTSQLVQELEEGYHAWRAADCPARLEDSGMLTGLAAAALEPETLSALLHTQYHHRQKSVASALKDW